MTSLGTARLEPALRTILVGKLKEGKKLKYALHTKARLERVAEDLEKWHERFDPSWYLLARSTAVATEQYRALEQWHPDKELAIIQELHRIHKANVDPTDPRDYIDTPGNSARPGAIREPLYAKDSIFLLDDFRIYACERIPNAYAETGRIGDELIMIDHFVFGANQFFSQATADVRDMGRILSKIDPLIFGLLRCRGVMKEYNDFRNLIGFAFVLEVPRNFGTPRCLRSILLDESASHALDDRFRLAKLLA